MRILSTTVFQDIPQGTTIYSPVAYAKSEN